MSGMGGCLTEVELFQAFRGELAVEDSTEALHHVLACPLCHEQWRRFLVDEQVAEGIRSAVRGDLRRADETPGVAAAIELPDKLVIPGFRLRGDYVDGGQARVYHAVHEASQEEVAIKVFHNSALNEGGNSRFSRELQSLARLRHPNVIPIRSAGEILGHAYFVMPWIEGSPLDQYIRNHPLTLAERIDLIIKISGAVEHAHQRGVMHLDLKPSNVRVDQSDEPVVMDFGLARLTGGDAADAAVSGLGIAGTPAYMAPEQVQNREDVDIRADVFMLGLLLYEVLAERRARPALDEHDHTRGLDIALRAPRPIREVKHRIDAELAAIVGAATALDRAERYPTAKALIEDLGRYTSGAPVQVMGGGLWYRFRKVSRKHLAGVLGAIIVILILATAASIFLEARRFTEKASGEAGRVTESLIRTSERLYEGRLAKTFEELSRLHAELGHAEEAADYAAQAAMSRTRAQPRPASTD